MTRNGQLFGLPQSEHHIGVNGSLSSPTVETSLLRTPTASEGAGGPISPATAKAKNQTLRLTGQVLDLFHPGILD